MSKNVELYKLGQSLWYDNIQRKLINDGSLQKMIEDGDIYGVTSNPSIFMKAIAKSSDYDAAIKPLVQKGLSADEIFWELAVQDIQAGADLLRPLYDRTNKGDGYISLEVDPNLANDTETTISEAKRLWKWVNRPNLCIKIPATPAGIPAIRAAIAAGINVNVTLIFAPDRYVDVMNAHISGLEDRAAAGLAAVAGLHAPGCCAQRHLFPGADLADVRSQYSAGGQPAYRDDALHRLLPGLPDAGTGRARAGSGG